MLLRWREGLQDIPPRDKCTDTETPAGADGSVTQAGMDLLPFAQAMPPADHPQPPVIEGAV